MILTISSESKQKYFSEKQKGGVVYKITNEVDGKKPTKQMLEQERKIKSKKY